MIQLYTTHCPQCNVLATKLKQKNISFTEVENIELMLSLGITAAPMLQVDGGPLMNFSEAIAWVNTQED